MSCKQCEICKCMYKKVPSEKTARAIQESKVIQARFTDVDELFKSLNEGRKMNMKNVIVAAYVHAYEAGMINSREEMLEKLVIELTKRLEKLEEEIIVGMISK